MPKSPTCANCGRPMIETPRSMQAEGEWDVNVFECSACCLDYFTEDHVPLTGLSARPSAGARFIAAMRRMVQHTTTPTGLNRDAVQRLIGNLFIVSALAQF